MIQQELKNKMLLAGLLAALLAFGVSADEDQEEEEEAGFYGHILAGGVWTGGRPSALEVYDDNEIMYDLNGSSQRVSETMPVVLFELGYVFQPSGTKLFLSTPEAEMGLCLGIAQPIEKIGSLSLSGRYSDREAWEDPYRTGVKREKPTKPGRA